MLYLVYIYIYTYSLEPRKSLGILPPKVGPEGGGCLFSALGIAVENGSFIDGSTIMMSNF
jgi:hypothetical protein